MNKRRWISAVIAAFLSVGIAFGARSKPIPTRIQVTPLLEKVAVNDHVVSFSAQDLSFLLNEAFKQKTPIPVLFEHADGRHAGTAAGWLTDCSLEKSGIWCNALWTPYGREAACTGGWRFISPAVRLKVGEDGIFHPTSIIEVSLTNIPALDGMAPVEVPGCPVPFVSSWLTTYPGVKALGKS